MKNRAFKQAKVRRGLGGFQVQLSVCMSHYIVYINLSLMGTMWWHTTGAPFLRQHYPGAEFWMFALAMFLVIACVMLFDYKFIYPSRQGFISKQAYKHENPAVADLQKILTQNMEMKADIGLIKDKLGIEK